MHIIDFNNVMYQWSGVAFRNICNRSFWVFDLEATGLDFNTERVIQFGAIAVEDGEIDKSSTFTCVVDPECVIPEKIEKMTGVTNELVHNAPKFPEAFSLFLSQAGERIWITQAGYEFDCPLLVRECTRHGIRFPNVYILDTKALFAFLHHDRSEIFNTDFLMRYYEIDPTGLRRHDALGDALLIAKIFCAELAELRARGLTEVVVETPLSIRKSLPDQTPLLSWTEHLKER
jgi:DNA polymerase III epsilon subunit-like protein